MIKRYTVVLLVLLVVLSLFGCMTENKEADPSDSAVPTVEATPTESAAVPTLTLNEAISLACEKLDINPVYVTYDRTDSETGDYVLEIGYDTYFIDPFNGDFKRDNGMLGESLIINLLGDITPPADTNTEKSIEEVVIENIKNETFDSDNALYSAKERIPYFVSDYHEGTIGGLVIDNEYKKLDALGISAEDLSTFASSGYVTTYFVDVNNDGIDELCSDYIVGTGQYPYTDIFKLDESTNEYTAFSLFDRLPDMFTYRWVQFFKCSGVVYTVVFFDTEYQIYEVTGDAINKVSEIRMTYPTYTVKADGDSAVLSYLQEKYTAQLPYAYPGITASPVLTTYDSVYSKMDKSIRDAYIGKSYTVSDLDNDNSDEVVFQWVTWSQTKLGDTLYVNAYAVFKLVDGQYELYDTNNDTNADNSAEQTVPTSPDGAGYPLNVFFETYDGKTYSCVIETGYSEAADFENRYFETVTVYLMEGDATSKIGTLDIIYKPQIDVDPDTENGTLKALENKGISIDPAQSFMVNLNEWGRVIFVSAYDLNKDGDVVFYIADSGSRIIYTFPDFYGNNWTVDALKALAFRDINGDGLTDVVIIADCMTGLGEDGAVPFTVAAVYFQTEDGFETDEALMTALNDAEMNDSVAKVMAFFKEQAEPST